MLPPANIDISVLILFFNRPDHLSQVFAQVRKARPARLFLYQDGPRGERDMAGIEACRKVVETIDWECEVHRNYQERNWGCDPSEYLSQKWAFSMADKCIVLEDDDVPSLTFFTFCKEMLDRYEHDERIVMISGFNIDEVTPDVADSYFFTSTFSIWGWASWRRVIDRWEGDYAFLNDEHAGKATTPSSTTSKPCSSCAHYGGSAATATTSSACASTTVRAARNFTRAYSGRATSSTPAWPSCLPRT